MHKVKQQKQEKKRNTDDDPIRPFTQFSHFKLYHSEYTASDKRKAESVMVKRSFKDGDI